MDGYRKNNHFVFDINYHVIWDTKYRYKILNEPIAIRTRELSRQGYEARDITLLQGSVGKEHTLAVIRVHLVLLRVKLCRRSSRLLQDQFPELKKKYWGQHLWARGYFCARVGTVDEETIRNYIANRFNEEKNDLFRIET